MMVRPSSCAVLLVTALAACGPVPVEVAERRCARVAQDAAGLSGTARIGVVSDSRGVRPKAGLDLRMSSAVFTGRQDPDLVYESCVMSQSGKAPTRSYQMVRTRLR